jgi:signal transduction histidine kinase/DNA-binding response OmpR family regulator
MATILTVDDDDLVRGTLVALLRSNHHHVLEAANGVEALDIVRAQRPDLVITDVLMPAMDGYELVRQLRIDPELAGTPVIFHTAIYSHPKARALAQAGGVIHLLNKPANLDTILGTVEAALAGRQPAPPLSSETYDREHLRLVTDRLVQEVNELQAVNTRLGTLLEVSRQLTLERDPQRLLEVFGEAARDLLGARHAAIRLLDAGGHQLVPAVSTGEDLPAAAWLNCPLSPPLLLHQLMTDHRPLRLAWNADSPAPHAFLGVPITSMSRFYGVLMLTDKRRAAEFSSQDERVAVTLAAEVAVAYENARRYDEIQHHALRLEQEVNQRIRAEEALREYSERLQSLSRQLLHAQETERRHLARELHDEIGQALTALKINLQGLHRSLGNSPLTGRLDDSIGIVERTLDQVRNLSLDLRPSMLDDLGLIAALRWYLDRQALRAGLSVQAVLDPLTRALDPEVETACFRLVQEAVTNIVRHAHARLVRVEMHQSDAGLELVVRDDGAGFDVAAARERAAQGASLGLLGMQERVTLLGGVCDITSTPGQGTTVQVRFTLPPSPES